MILGALPLLAILTVDDAIPAGNIIHERTEGDTVYVRQDLRDTQKGQGWFYWAMRVRGAAGRTLAFAFTDPYGGGPVGVRGPVVSTDRGKSFSYPLDGKSTSKGFTYSFAADQDEVWFYECHPYLRADWDAFVARHEAVRGSRFVTETLCRSRKGADVPRARFGCIGREPRYRVFMSARHHCSESMASWVLEGVAEAFLADDALGGWLRENVELMMVPMTDYDGVQAGDQGKVRAPHDHNRDYSEFLYPETKAIAEWIGCHAGGKLDVFIDVHCPWIRGEYNEWLYTPWKDPKILPSAADERRYSKLLEDLQCGSMRYRASDDLQFGQRWNTGANYGMGWSAVIWACNKVKGLRIARSYEVPFANANGAVVTPEACRELGRDTAKVFRAFFLDSSAETVFLECEAFEDRGGWVNDTQFMDQMGSPYLLAHGLGKPVADAKTSFAVRKTGTYDVWVRTKNWTSPWHPDRGAGTFSLIVNGQKLPNPLGVQGKGEWLWVKADPVKLECGRTNTVALHDRDGFDGRCDAVVFTTEGKPPFGRPTKQSDQSDNRTASCDLCVVGGGIGGICTAVSAARLGLKVALVHDRPVLGGNNSSEVRVHLGAWQNVPPYPRLGDVLAEFGPKRGGNAESAANYEDDRKMAIVKAERNVGLFLNRRVTHVVTNACGAIAEVRAIDTRYGDALRIKARWFADCTGDGTVGYLAGADWRMGREAKGETGEPWAPEKGDMLTMGASVQWRAKTGPKVKNGCEFPFRPWMIRFTDENGRAELKGDWDWETGLGRDQIADAEYIRDYGLLVAYSNWAYAKNASAKRDEFADKELEWVAYIAGRRETRRLMGDFVLSEKHILERDVQPDGTCAATWTIDLHFPKTKAETRFDGEPFRSNSENERIWPYPIPYRCYYSRNVPNLFMAGRCISVTHVALGTTRLMRTIGMMGEVVGMAASICKTHGCDPRDVYVKYLEELKALMAKGVGDGRAHPPQAYNCQESQDPAIREKYLDGMRGRLER